MRVILRCPQTFSPYSVHLELFHLSKIKIGVILALLFCFIVEEQDSFKPRNLFTFHKVLIKTLNSFDGSDQSLYQADPNP